MALDESRRPSFRPGMSSSTSRMTGRNSRPATGVPTPPQPLTPLAPAPSSASSPLDTADAKPFPAGLRRRLDQRDDGGDGGGAEIEMHLPAVPLIDRALERMDAARKLGLEARLAGLEPFQ